MTPFQLAVFLTVDLFSIALVLDAMVTLLLSELD